MMLSGSYRRWRSPQTCYPRTSVIRIQVPEAQAQAVEQAFRQATVRKSRDRLQIIRLAHRGRPHQDIASDLGITPRTVQRWLNRYLELCIAGLHPRKDQTMREWVRS